MPGRAPSSSMVADFFFQDLPCSSPVDVPQPEEKLVRRSKSAGRRPEGWGITRGRGSTMPKAARRRTRVNEVHGDLSRKHSSQAEVPCMPPQKECSQPAPLTGNRYTLKRKLELGAGRTRQTCGPPRGFRTREVLRRASIDDATDRKSCKGWRIPLGPPTSLDSTPR